MVYICFSQSNLRLRAINSKIIVMLFLTLVAHKHLSEKETKSNLVFSTEAHWGRFELESSN